MGPAKSSAVERRNSARHLVVYRLDVTFPDGSPGCLLDLSTTGMRVRFRGDLDVGAIQGLRIEFPRWLELGEGLDVAGRFVWLRGSGTESSEAGFAFDGLSRKDENVLSVLLQRLAEAREEDALEEA